MLIGGFVVNYRSSISSTATSPPDISPTPIPDYYQFTINYLKSRTYPASDIHIDQALSPGSNYRRYIASYVSDGLTIYGLFTVPISTPPTGGFPAIVFLHGYLDPRSYQTTARYVAYQDGFAKNGFVTFKPDLRGHGRSQGSPANSNFSQAYVVDTLNLISALKANPQVNSHLIGIWGHSNGGGIALRALEASPDIKAAVIWAGVVGSYQDLLVAYRPQIPWLSHSATSSASPDSPDGLIKKYGPPNPGSAFWSAVDPYSYLSDITAPVQLHHGTADTSVPLALSQHLYTALTQAGKTVEFYQYPGADHNLASPAFSTAMSRSIAFFQKYLRD